MQTLLQDARYGLRMLAKNPGPRRGGDADARVRYWREYGDLQRRACGAVASLPQVKPRGQNMGLVRGPKGHARFRPIAGQGRMLASHLPARRAAQIDLMAALRHE